MASLSSLGVTAVVRFNKKVYDRRHFLEAGINHHDLFYEVKERKSRPVATQSVPSDEFEQIEHGVRRV